MIDDLIVGNKVFIALTNDEALRDAHTEAFQVLVQRELVKSHGFDEYAAGRIRHSDKIEIALQDTILTRGAMNGDVGEIGMHRTTSYLEREILAAHCGAFAVCKMCFPYKTSQFDDEYLEAFLVDEARNYCRLLRAKR